MNKTLLPNLDGLNSSGAGCGPPPRVRTPVPIPTGKHRLPVWGGGFGLNGLVQDAIETLDEGGWVFERDAFEKEGLVEE